MLKNKKIAVVMPAYNAEKTLAATFKAVESLGIADLVVIVDDASKDKTYDIARGLSSQSLKLLVKRHERNTGYGGNQKTCYKLALREGADIVVMIHPDYQYDPRVTPYMVGIIAEGICDVMLGNRIRTRREALDGGMPFYKYVANRGLTMLENLMTGQNLGEWHSGLRAYSRQVLETISWELNSDDFVFDTEFLVQAANAKCRLGDVPVAAKYFEEASSINFRRSVAYGLSSLYLLFRYALRKAGLADYPLLRVKTPARHA